MERFRTANRDVVDWPEWCLVPASAAAVVAHHGQDADAAWTEEEAASIAPLNALFAWRWGRQILRVDPDLADALAATPLDGDLPDTILYSLPAWCVYVAWGRDGIAGAYVLLDRNLAAGTNELRILVDLENNQHLGMSIVLTGGTLADGVETMVGRARATRAALPDLDLTNSADLDDPTLTDHVTGWVRPIVAIVLYLCSQHPDVTDPAGRSPTPRRPPGPTPGPAVWNVGWRIGTRLRQARATRQPAQGGTHASPEPHLRAAHWHPYRTGPRDDPDKQDIVVWWLPPTLVGGGTDNLTTTIRDT